MTGVSRGDTQVQKMKKMEENTFADAAPSLGLSLDRCPALVHALAPGLAAHDQYLDLDLAHPCQSLYPGRELVPGAPLVRV